MSCPTTGAYLYLRKRAASGQSTVHKIALVRLNRKRVRTAPDSFSFCWFIDLEH
jgi:hypothetical protein